MKITDLKCAVLGQNPVVRLTTDEGISGYGEVEASKSYLKPHSSSTGTSFWEKIRPMLNELC